MTFIYNLNKFESLLKRKRNGELLTDEEEQYITWCFNFEDYMSEID